MTETEKGLRDQAKTAHDILSAAFYARSPSKRKAGKAAFDQAHGKIWGDLETELIAAGYRAMPVPPRDLEAEIDELRQRLDTLATA